MSGVLMVRAYHSQVLKYCKAGTKKFIEDNGLDWATFVNTGYPADKILAMNDVRATRVVEVAKREAENGR